MEKFEIVYSKEWHGDWGGDVFTPDGHPVGAVEAGTRWGLRRKARRLIRTWRVRNAPSRTMKVWA